MVPQELQATIDPLNKGVVLFEQFIKSAAAWYKITRLHPTTA
jgi:hypothetical protein